MQLLKVSKVQPSVFFDSIIFRISGLKNDLFISWSGIDFPGRKKVSDNVEQAPRLGRENFSRNLCRVLGIGTLSGYFLEVKMVFLNRISLLPPTKSDSIVIP